MDASCDSTFPQCDFSIAKRIPSSRLVELQLWCVSERGEENISRGSSQQVPVRLAVTTFESQLKEIVL